MKLLVLGASGMAGHTIALYFWEKGHSVTTFTRAPFSIGSNVRGDVEDQAQLKKLLTEGEFDAVINCVGMLNSACDREPAKAVYVNSYLPHLLAELLKPSKTQLIHMSTDCVFSGQSSPYRESSFPDGTTLYDRSKALGELNNEQSLTFRNSIIGPDMKSDGIGLFNWFMKQSGTIYGYTGAIWTGVTTLTLAKAMEQALAERLTGLYHLVYPSSISKFELLKLFNKYFKRNSLTILPSNAVQADKTLINQRNDFGFTVPDYEKMIVEMKNWIMQHPALYPHYAVLN